MSTVLDYVGDLDVHVFASPCPLFFFCGEKATPQARLAMKLICFCVAGHVYAGGCILAMVHDYKVMRTERGWYCLSEVHIKRNFTAGLIEVLKSVDKLGI